MCHPPSGGSAEGRGGAKATAIKFDRGLTIRPSSFPGRRVTFRPPLAALDPPARRVTRSAGRAFAQSPSLGRVGRRPGRGKARTVVLSSFDVVWHDVRPPLAALDPPARRVTRSRTPSHPPSGGSAEGRGGSTEFGVYRQPGRVVHEGQSGDHSTSPRCARPSCQEGDAVTFSPGQPGV